MQKSLFNHLTLNILRKLKKLSLKDFLVILIGCDFHFPLSTDNLPTPGRIVLHSPQEDPTPGHKAGEYFDHGAGSLEDS